MLFRVQKIILGRSAIEVETPLEIRRDCPYATSAQRVTLLYAFQNFFERFTSVFMRYVQCFLIQTAWYERKLAALPAHVAF